MGNFPEQVYGKTGTAQYTGQPDYSWYVCFVPATATSKPILVVVTVPRAGFGAQAAAPVARQILSQWFFGKPGSFLGQQHGRGTMSVTSGATPIRPVEDKSSAAGVRLSALLMIDPLLMVAALGVVVCSLITLHVAARGQVPGPSYYVERQVIYAVIGVIVAIGLALFDYSLVAPVTATSSTWP